MSMEHVDCESIDSLLEGVCHIWRLGQQVGVLQVNYPIHSVHQGQVKVLIAIILHLNSREINKLRVSVSGGIISGAAEPQYNAMKIERLRF